MKGKRHTTAEKIRKLREADRGISIFATPTFSEGSSDIVKIKKRQ
jgi:hypothetical protein